MNTDVSPQRGAKNAKKGDFWRGLECMSSGQGLMADWDWAFGSAIASVVPLLRPTEKESDSFPCPARPACECRHEIQETDFGLVAVCMCGGGECDSVVVEPKDIVVHRFDVGRFGKSLRQALGFSEPDGSAYASVGLQEIGSHAAAAAPVYLSLARSNMLLRELQKLVGLRDAPFLLLTPTGSGWSPEVEAMARAHGAGHISLSSVLNVQPDGTLVSRETIGPMLDEFRRRVGRGSGLATMVQRIDSNLLAIAKSSAELRRENGELRSAKQRLEKMLADGMFAFTRKVDAKSFHAFCTILAEGDVSKAARTLEMGDSTLRDLLREWERRGGAYARMFDVVRWRKRVGRTEKVPLNDEILLGKAQPTDYPALLSEVLEGLLSMTESNWEGLSRELAEIVMEKRDR
jgi:hypothetical protein